HCRRAHTIDHATVFLHVLSTSSFFFFQSSRPHRDLHSFPTRRSSDLSLIDATGPPWTPAQPLPRGTRSLTLQNQCPFRAYAELRSEEHTSELQSLRHLVCRLLLEKKKK